MAKQSGRLRPPTPLNQKELAFLQTVRNFVFSSDNILVGQQEDRINILLLGIGGSGHDGPYLSGHQYYFKHQTQHQSGGYGIGLSAIWR